MYENPLQADGAFKASRGDILRQRLGEDCAGKMGMGTREVGDFVAKKSALHRVLRQHLLTFEQQWTDIASDERCSSS